MDTKKLRQKILDLAIRGKLVPQDPNDEPASVLLERIREEKERLIKEGKIKRDKSDTSHYRKSITNCQLRITNEEVPFEVPESWVWCRLNDIGTTNIGLTYKPSEVCNNGIPVLRSNNIKGDKLDLSDLVKVASKLADNLIVVNGDILICARNGSRALVGKCTLISDIDETVTFGAFMTIYRSIFNHYIFRFLNSSYFRSRLDESNSTQISQLTQDMLKNTLIPIPPLAEQSRIVSKIEECFTLIDQIENNELSLSKFIKQTKSKVLELAIHGKLVPQDSITNYETKITNEASDSSHYPFEVPENWIWRNLGEVNNIARGGSPRPIKDYLTTSEDGINWIKIGDTEKCGKYIYSTQEKIIKDGIKHSRFVNVDDFLLTNSMSFGRPYILKTDGCIHDGWLVISVEKRLLDVDFMYYLLSSEFMYDQFSNSAVGSTVKNLKTETVQKISFPIPPLAEQHRIVQKIETIFQILDSIQINL